MFDNYKWKVKRGKWYTITLCQIFPIKNRNLIQQKLQRDGDTITFKYFDYDKKNKIMFISNEEFK